jgi:hypothetical protein
MDGKRKQEDTKVIGTGILVQAEGMHQEVKHAGRNLLKLVAKRDGGLKKSAAVCARPAKRALHNSAAGCLQTSILCFPAGQLPN